MYSSPSSSPPKNPNSQLPNLLLPSIGSKQSRYTHLPRAAASMVRIDHHEYLSEEEKRLKEDRERTKYWKKWGPYVAERQWATGIIHSFTC
jgi:hypothetical protein